MEGDIVLGEGWQITLCILYILGAIVSLWMIVLSPYLIEWMGASLHRKPHKDQKDWAKIFLLIVLFQPLTFLASAVGLWWVGAMAILPPVHFLLSIGSLLAIDFFREEEPWEKEYRKLTEW